MRIGGNSLTGNVYQLYQKNQTSGTQTTAFNGLLRAATDGIQNAAAMGGLQGHRQAKLSPYVQIWRDYKDWKSQQPERILPNSQGVTDENLAYLLENFTGELSVFQCIEVVDTMREMGIITNEQMNEALGFGKSGWVEGDTSIVVGELESGRDMDSTVFEHPLMDVSSLDDLFDLLDRLLRDDNADDIANDLRESFERVKQEVQGGVTAYASTQLFNQEEI